MSADAYASAVIGTLAGDFPDLNDPDVADVVRYHVIRHASDPGGFLEVIVDDPISARWRLKAAPGRRKRGRVRLACMRLNPSEADLEREERLNAALDTLDPDMEEQR